MNNKFKSKIKIQHIMYPKNVNVVEAGDFCIFTAKILEHLEGNQPIISDFYKTMTLKGNVPSLKIDDEFIAIYENPETNKFGTTYNLTMLTKEIDRTNKKQVKDYLKLICGEKIAEELMQFENPIEMIENKETEKLLQIKGIGEKKLEQIYKNIEANADYSLAYTELVPLGLTKNLISRICSAFGNAQQAIDVCKNNPYKLINKVKGVSFLSADEIANKIGISPNNRYRIISAIEYVLKEAASNGRTYLTTQQFESCLLNLNVNNVSVVKECVDMLITQKTILMLNNNKEIALTKYFELEKEIAIELKRIKEATIKIDKPKDWEEQLETIENTQGWKHTDEQKQAIKSILENNLTIISGGAGCGKTTIVNAVLNILKGYYVEQVALSAKAAQRMQEVTNRESQTIHRLLGIGTGIEKPVYAEILVIDEASMINGSLFLTLLKAIKNGTKVIILGDDKQLQPIGDCSVFSDILKANTTLNKKQLTKIHRQAQASAIITKSLDIRNQNPLYEKGFTGHRILGELQDLELFIQEENEILLHIIKKRFEDEFKKTDNILEVQILSAVKNRGELSTQNINNEIQKIYNPNALDEKAVKFITKNKVNIFEGDKIINTVNNYKTRNINKEKSPIFNGNIGIVKKITDKEIHVDFNNTVVIIEGEARNNLNLAYAITIHSAQGSQWQSVICAFDISMWVLLNVEMLYTAITRASKHCIIVAQNKAIQQAIKTVEQKTKQTYLDKFLYNV